VWSVSVLCSVVHKQLPFFVFENMKVNIKWLCVGVHAYAHPMFEMPSVQSHLTSRL